MGDDLPFGLLEDHDLVGMWVVVVRGALRGATVHVLSCENGVIEGYWLDDEERPRARVWLSRAHVDGPVLPMVF